MANIGLTQGEIEKQAKATVMKTVYSAVWDFDKFKQDQAIISFKAGAEAQLAKLVSVTDKEMVEIIRSFLDIKFNDWDDSKCADCHNNDNAFCTVGGLDTDEIKSCPQMGIALVNISKDLLFQLTLCFEAQKAQARKEGREEVFVYLENDYPDEANSIRQALKEVSNNE